MPAGRIGPKALTAAQLNLPFCAATLILTGDAFVEEFTSECVNDRARIELARKVQVIHDPAITALGAAHRHQARVEVHFRDGSVEHETRDAPRGSEQCFADETQIIDKFRKLTRATIAPDRQNALIDAVLQLEQLPDSRAMIEPLPPESPFWTLPNVFITPHVGGYVVEYEDFIMPLIIDNMRLFLAGRLDEMANIVTR